MRRRATPLLFCAIILLACSQGVCAFKYVQSGMEAPTGRCVTLDGKDVAIESLSGERGTLLFFWALWSPRSVQQLQDLAAQQERLLEAGVQIVAVSVDKQDPGAGIVAAIRGLRDEHGIRFPMLIDPGLQLFYAYGVVAVPSTAVIHPEGRVLYSLAGYSPYAADTMIGTSLALLGVERSEDVVAPSMPLGKSYRYFGLGVRLYRQGKAESAISSLKMAAAADSTFGPAQYYLALSLQETADARAAREAFARAVECDPFNPVYRVAWAQCELRAGDTAAALGLVAEAVEHDTTYVEGWGVLARVHLARGLWDEAAAALARGHAVDSQSLELGDLEVWRLTAEGDTAAALLECRRLLDHRLGTD